MNTREIASFILLAALVMTAMYKGENRRQLGRVVRLFLERRIMLVTGGYAAYIIAAVCIVRTFELWDRHLLIETLLWFVASGFPLVLSVTDAAKDRRYLQRTARSVFEIWIIVVFFINLVSFSLVWELLLQVVLIMLVGTLLLANGSDEYERIRPLLASLLAGVLLFLAIYAAVHLYQHRSDIDWERVVLSFLLTIWLPLVTIGFLVPLAYLMEYDSAYQWMTLGSPKRTPSFRDKVALVIGLNVHLREVHAFRPYWGTQVKDARSMRDKLREVRRFRQHLRQRKTEARNTELLIRQYTGDLGTDQNGRRLDRREFKETTDVLRWVAICQMGHFRKRNDSYNPDIMVVLSDLTGRGLPPDHGISVRISEDGKAWYGWRRTVTGWVFAIGAALAPPDEWLYDGPEPPFDFPSEETGWDRFLPGPRSRNW